MVSSTVLDLGWIPISIAALVYYLLGAIWFTPLFGTIWDRSIGHTRQTNIPFQLSFYIIPLLSALLVTVVLAFVLDLVNPCDLGDTIGVGAIVAVGLALPISVNNALTPQPAPISSRRGYWWLPRSWHHCRHRHSVLVELLKAV
ncbi:DUF1761 domain-containing protein [Rhodococcus qingshengii]|uniref:DUF1761 domain-containing protein n=1 Tax=Rhodococcus qingshengii TaxID=334542 RepID=UPI003015CE59